MSTASDSPSNMTRTGRLAMAALLLAAAGLAAPGTALADRGHRHHGHGHGHGHGGPRVSIHLSTPAYRPHVYAPPRVYHAPPVYHAPRVIYAPPVVHAPPVVYSSGVYSSQVYSSRVYSPPVMVERVPPVYVERNDIATAPPPVEVAAGGSWFFCADSNTYYPYVTHCASPWERVTPTPPTAGR